MSQKTELQSNNTDLQAILATINALPEAGGGSNTENLETVLAEQAALIEELSTTLDSKAAGGGGGSVETCTVTFADYGIEEAALDSIIAYTDENSQVVSKTFREFDVRSVPGLMYDVYGSVTVKVGTLFYINSWMDLFEGEGIVLDRCTFVINGDCSIFPY